MAYVTGAHSMRVGYHGSYMVEDIENHGNELNLAFTLNNGPPDRSSPSRCGFSDRRIACARDAFTSKTSGRAAG